MTFIFLSVNLILTALTTFIIVIPIYFILKYIRFKLMKST
jgi:hypothetical protein